MKIALSISLFCLALVGCATQSEGNKHKPGAILAPAEFPKVAGETAAKATSQRTPKIIAMRNPVYPFELRKRGIQAVVIVEYIVKADGSVLIERVLNSPNSLFNTAIIRAATEWRFEPNIVDGRPVNTRMRVPITFKL